MSHLSQTLHSLAASLRASAGIVAKSDIAAVAEKLALATSPIAVGDDCAAIQDANGFLLLAIEGFINAFVAADPWFAGWCSIMVNLSDIAAMGGRPLAVVDAIWAQNAEAAAPILAGMKAAAETYNVPIIGGHSNLRNDRPQLSVAILGRAQKLLSSFTATPGDRLLAAIDLRGEYRPQFSNWQAALGAPPERLRADLDLLPQLAESGLCITAKDISQGGLIGTALMLAECSKVSMVIDLDAIPTPPGVPQQRWLTSFPSFGFLLSVPPKNVTQVISRFAARDIAIADIGAIRRGSKILLRQQCEAAELWDFATTPLLGCAP